MLIGFLIVFLTVLFDQVTKHLAAHYIKPGESIVVINKLFELGYYENRGISFGLLEGHQLFFALVTIIALSIFGYLFLDLSFKDKKVYSIAITLFIGGTFGNAIDRALLGYVIDFMHFPFLTPILGVVGLSNFYNNVADMVLSLAIVLLIIELFILEPKRLKKMKLKENENIQD
jgi:signal peptidase II